MEHGRQVIRCVGAARVEHRGIRVESVIRKNRRDQITPHAERRPREANNAGAALGEALQRLVDLVEIRQIRGFV